MIPKKAKDFIASSAVQEGVPEEHLRNILTFYFDESKSLLSKLEHINVRFSNLGTFVMKGWKLDKEIGEQTDRLRRCKVPENIAERKQNIEYMERALVKWNKQEARKKEIKRLKTEYYDKKEKGEGYDPKGDTSDSLEK